MLARSWLVIVVLVLGCDGGAAIDAGLDAGARADAGATDAAGLDATASDAGAGDAGSDGGAAGPCPPGSESLALSLDGVSLERVAGVPPDDGFATGFAVVEGPVWARGALYFSHFQGGPSPPSRILRLEPGGAVSVAAPSAGVNGLALGPDGRLYGGRHLDGTVSVFDWDDLSAEPTPVVSTYLGTRFSSPNDLVIRSDGTIYFSDPAWQSPLPEPQAERRAYRVAPDGTVEAIPEPPDRPNGILLTRDERTLLVTGTDGMRRYDLAPGGEIAAGPTDVSAVTGGRDGMGLDCAGNVYVAGDDEVLVLDESLSRLGALPAPGATNVAFGGADGRTLYVTTLGDDPGLYSAELNVPGHPH